jgi:galactose mutarotase-like enzyme
MNEAHSSVTLSAGDYTAEIGLRGGQLLRLTHGEDDHIVPASRGAAGYPGAVLAPWPNRVAEATYAHQDIVYDLEANEERTGAALHGLLTDVDLTVRAEHDDHTELAGTIEPTSGYPFRVEVVLFYRLSPATGLASTFMARYRPDEESTAGEADADSAESEEADVLEAEDAAAEDAAAEDAAAEDPVLEDAVVADESAVHLGHEDAAQAQDEPDSAAEPADAAEASAEAELNTEGNSSTEGDPELAADGEKADDAESAQDAEDSDDVEPLDDSEPSEDTEPSEEAEPSEDAEAAAEAEDSAVDSPGDSAEDGAEDGAAAGPAEAGPLTAPFGAGFHPYLTAAGAALHECRLRLPARTVLTTAASGHVEGREAVAGDFDLSRGPLLGDRTIDHAYTDLPEEGWFAELSHGPTGFTVRMIADARWAQIYTGEAIDRAGVAVEPMSCPPDAFNSGEDLVQLAPGEWFRMGYSIEAIRDELRLS